MKKFGKVVSLFLALVMAIGILGVIGPIGVSAEGEDNVYMWPLYMEAGITGKGNTFDCYFGGTAAQGKAMYAKGILEMSINFPKAGSYDYEIIAHNQWNADKKSLKVWLDDDSANAVTHSYPVNPPADKPTNPTETPMTGSLTVSSPGVHIVKIQGSVAVVRVNIKGVAPVQLALAGPAADATGVVPNSLVFDWTQNSTDQNYYAIPNGATQFKLMVSDNSNFSGAYEKVITAEELGITKPGDPGQWRKRAQYQWKTSDGQIALGKTYYWKVVAINNNGSTESEVRSFTTVATQDTVAPTPGGGGTVTASDVTSHTATLKWAAATDNSSSADAIKYYIYRSENPISAIENAKEGTLLNEGGTAAITSYIDVTRVPETTYYYAVVAMDEAENEAMYTAVQVNTPAALANMQLWGAFTVNNISELQYQPPTGSGESNPGIGFARIHTGSTEMEINLPAAGTYVYSARVMGAWANGIGVTIHEKSDEEGKNAVFFPFNGANGTFRECIGTITVPAAGKYTLVINGGRDITGKERFGLDWLKVYGALPQSFGLVGPTDGTEDADISNLTFDWTLMAKAGNRTEDRPYWPNGAASYTITLDTQQDFNSGNAIVKSDIKPGQGYDGNAQYTWVPGEDGNLMPGTKYYWKVTAVNGNGSIDSSDVFSFTTKSGFGISSMKINGTAVSDNTVVVAGDNVVEVKLNNTDSSMNKAALVVALYNKSTKTLESAKVKSQTLSVGENTITADAISVPAEGEYTLKAFLWEDVDNMEPISKMLFATK